MQTVVFYLAGATCLGSALSVVMLQEQCVTHDSTRDL